MRKILASTILLTLLVLISCNTREIDKIQGVYEIDKTMLKTQIEENMGGGNKRAGGIAEAILTNAVMEFHITGDSIRGIFGLVGRPVVYNTLLEERDGKIYVAVKNNEAVITPTKEGFLFAPPHLNISLQFNKTNRKALSDDAQKAIDLQSRGVIRK